MCAPRLVRISTSNGLATSARGEGSLSNAKRSRACGGVFHFDFQPHADDSRHDWGRLFDVHAGIGQGLRTLQG